MGDAQEPACEELYSLHILMHMLMVYSMCNILLYICKYFSPMHTLNWISASLHKSVRVRFRKVK